MSDTQTTQKYLIGITDYITPPAAIEQEAFGEAKFIYLKDWRTSLEHRNQWQQVDALLVWHWVMDPETIDILDRCRIVVRYGVGYDLVDVKALVKQQIAFCNTPDYGTEEVADVACGMILAIQRKLLAYDRACRFYEKGWQEHLIKSIQRTSEQTLGIIGVGRIGTAVVNRMKPFGYRILGYDPYQPSGHEKAIGYQRTHTLEELLEQSDIVSMHCPLTSETRGMVNSDFLARMKPGASLVNTARGKIVADLDCVEQFLQSGHLAFIAFDVLPEEPPQEHSLLDAWRMDQPEIASRILINPHVAWYSERAWYEMCYKAAETARLYLCEGTLRNQITE